MAALEDSPSRCQGQAWMLWAQRTGLNMTNDESGDEKEVKDKREGDAMKLRKEDMALFGSCPAQEEFYLVVCEECGLVVKPQALRSHIERRHACSNSYTGNSDSSSSSSSKGSEISSNVANKLGVKEVCRSVSRNVTTSTKSCDKSSQQLSRFAISSKQQQNPNLVPPNKNNAGLHSKSEKLDAKTSVSACSSKKNHVISPPLVRVDRMLPNTLSSSSKKGVLNSTGAVCGPSVNVSPSVIPADKRELPSPQQPPPGTVSSPDSPYISSNSPNIIQTNQQCLATITTVNSNNQGSLTGMSTQSSALNKKSGNNGSTTVSNAFTTSTANLAESKPKPSKSKKVPKERKLLPCKDRVYDPDKHCGVFVPVTGKQCTRSLTCKTHSLAMRRNVPGRRKRFDELLSDHRATKEATVKASKATTVTNSRPSNSHDNAKINAAPVASTVGNSTNSYPKGLQQATSKLNCLSSGNASVGSTSGGGCSQRLPLNVSSTKSKISNAKNHVPPTPIQRSSTTGSLNQSCSNEAQKPAVLAQPSVTHVDKDDDGFITHHPKPAAVCTFNSRQMGLGVYVHDRKLDSIRAVLRLALGERISQPPSVKKLCVESKLPPVPESSDPSDPYCFTVGEQTNSFPSVTASASLTVPVMSCGKSPTTSATNVASSLKSPTILSHSFSMKSSQKSGKPCANRHIKNKMNKETTVVNANQPSASDQARKVTTAELNKSVRTGGGGPPLKRKRDSSTALLDSCDPVVNNNNNILNSPPYQTGAAHLQAAVNSGSTPTANLLSMPFPVGISAHLATSLPHLTATATPGKSGAVNPFIIPTCVSGLSVVGRNHANVVAGNSLKDLNLVVTNVEVVNGQLGHGVPVSTGTAAMISRTTNATACIPVTATGTVRSSLSGINLGLTAAGSTLTLAASPSYLSSGPTRASLVASSPSPSQLSTTFPLSSSSSSAAITKETKPSNVKRCKSSAVAKSVRQGHGSPNTSSVLTSAPAKWNKVNNTAVLTGLGALSNANLLSGTLATNNHITVATLDSSGISPPHSSFSPINIKPSLSTHLSTSSPLLNGLGPSASSPTASLQHRNLTNHILPANTATFTVNSDSQVGANSDCPTINSEIVQPKGRGSRPNACRSSVNPLAKHQISPAPNPGPGLVPSGQSINLSGNGGGSAKVVPNESDNSGNSGAIQELTNNSSPLSHLTPIPLKLLSSGLSNPVTSSKSKSQKPFGLHNAELKRPSEMQGSSTLPT